MRIDREAATVTVSHDAVPGLMEAMVMPFTVADEALLAGLAPGDRITFRLRVDGTRTRIDRLQIVSAAPVDAGLQNTPAAPLLVPSVRPCRISS